MIIPYTLAISAAILAFALVFADIQIEKAKNAIVIFYTIGRKRKMHIIHTQKNK